MPTNPHLLDERSATNAVELPRWDLDSLYPGVDSPELLRAIDDLGVAIEAMTGQLEDAIADDSGSPAGPLFDRLITQLNATLELFGPIESYLYGKVSADTADERAQARMSEVQERTIALQQIGPRLEAWLGSIDEARLQRGSSMASEYSDLIRVARRRAEHLLSPAEEDLLAELDSSGGSAWGRLHQDVGSQIVVILEGDDEYASKPLPISALRNLAYNANRSVRERAYDAELTAWAANAVPLAAAMNGIKGQVNVTSKRRRYTSPLDEGLAANRLDRPTLTALVSAAEAAFPTFRRFLRAKAKLLGLERLAWFDLFAPVGKAASVEAQDRWSYPNSTAFVERHFTDYSDRLGNLARRAFSEHWIDAGPRAGKVGGAYCMPFIAGESRILSNFTPSYSGMGTLAHELGHAYHNDVQSGEPAAKRGSPMVVAETASTFCETIIRQAGLREASNDDRLVILESFLSDATQIVVDILSRFRFESAVFEQRADRQLSPDDFCGLMLEAQRSTYGDGLDPERLHPYAWASKPHYYSPRSFYNYPYLFGQLFGIGLFAAYQSEPDTFHDRYDDLLRRTGQADPAELAAQFGVDIRDRAFWATSLDSLETDIEAFIALVDERLLAGARAAG